MSSPSKSSQESRKKESSSSKDKDKDRDRDKEKSSHKQMFAGFQARTIRSFWEQHNQQQDIDISPEVLSRLAEDTTYRVWEIINNVKTYTKHSGGFVTSDITNDVLKDANCEPIVGASCGDWGRIDDGGFYHFLEDNTVNLRDEYTNEIVLNENAPLSLDVFWFLDEKIEADKGELFNVVYNNLIKAIFKGDLACFNSALDIISNSPHMTGFLRHFLKKWIDLIGFDYRNNVLERCIKFLEALMRNPCTVMSHMNIELKYLCQLLVNLLVGPDKEEQEQEHQEYQDSLDPPYYHALLIGDDIKKDTFEHDLNSFTGMNGMEIKMENLADLNTYDFNDQENFPPQPTKNDEEENYELADNATVDFNEKSEDDYANDLFNFKVTTKICDDRYVDDICKLLGLCAVKWAGVENLCTYLLINKVENYFATNKAEISERDYEWLQRVIRGLWSLGEFAFREFLIYFEKIDTTSDFCPENFANYLNLSGIYMRGKGDIFFYEYVADAVGDKILPFLLYYSNFLLKLDKKYYKQHKRSLNSELYYHFPQKIKLTMMGRLVGQQQLYNAYPDFFPDHQRFISKNSTTIHFRFSGCRQIYVKKPKKVGGKMPDETAGQSKKTLVQNKEMLWKFNQKIVIARKKLRKPATNRVDYHRMHNYHHLTF